MSASGYTPILLYGSTTASNIPLAANLTTSASGIELAVNAADGKLFYKDSGGVVQVLASKAGNVNVSSFSAGTTGFTPNTATTGAVTLAGTLATTNGGTGLTSFTANGVVYASSTSALTTGSALTFDGSNLTNTGTGSFGSLVVTSASGTLNTSANAAPRVFGSGSVLYNATTQHIFETGGLGSPTEQMRLTSTGLGIGTSSPSYKLDVQSSATYQANFQTTAANAYGQIRITGNSRGGELDFYNGSTVLGGIYADATKNLYLVSNGSTVGVTLDSSGNLGLGVTPSAWSGIGKTLQVNTGGSFSADSANSYFATNSYYNGTNWIYNTSNYATRYTSGAGQHQWYTAPSGTAGNAITFTQAMTLDASGNLLVGTTSSSSTRLFVQADSGIQAVLRNTYAYGYTSLRLYNDQNSSVRALEIDYTGSSYAGGEQAIIGTTGAYPLVFLTSNTERMRLDASGNLGLGVTPSAWNTSGSSYKAIQLGVTGSIYGRTSNEVINVASNTYVNSSGVNTYIASGNTASIYQQASGQHQWYSAPAGTAGNAITFTNTMTLDSTGALLLGTTTNTPSTGGIVFLSTGTTSSPRIVTDHASGTASGNSYANFTYAGTIIGSITQSGTTAVLYNLTSDQRLKTNIADAAPASALIDAIQVRQYDWKSDGSHQRYGFIAQELVAVAPEAVHQPADPEEMMAVDYSKLVPMLVKEIQSLRVRLAALEAK